MCSVGQVAAYQFLQPALVADATQQRFERSGRGKCLILHPQVPLVVLCRVCCVVFLLNNRSREKLVNFPSPAAQAEFKSTMSLPDAGMANCRVRPGRTDGNRTHARTVHCFASVLGHIPCASSWHLFDWPGRCEPP